MVAGPNALVEKRPPAGLGEPGRDRMLHLLHTDELLALARTRVTRSLTDDECRQYLQVPRCPRTP